MSAYIRVFARPMGAEPKIFYSKEQAETICECEDNECSPWCTADIVEFNSENSALEWMKVNYPLAYEECVSVNEWEIETQESSK